MFSYITYMYFNDLHVAFLRFTCTVYLLRFLSCIVINKVISVEWSCIVCMETLSKLDPDH